MTYVFRTRINDLAEEIHRSGKGIGKYYESLYSEAPERAEPFIDALWSEAVKFHEFPALTGTRPSPLINVFLYGELRWVPFPLVDDLGRQAFKSRPPEVPHITSLIARLKEKPPRNVNGLDVRVFEDMVGVLQLLEYALIGPLGSTLPGVGGSMPPEIKKALIGTDLDWRDRVTHRSNIHDAFNEYWFADAKRDVGIGATDLDGAGDFETSPLSGEDLDLFDTFSLPKALGVHYRGNGN